MSSKRREGREIQTRRQKLGTGEGVESEEVVREADSPRTIVKRTVCVPGTAYWGGV